MEEHPAKPSSYDTMNRSTTGSERKSRLEKLQAQTEALFNEIFQSLDSGDAQIEG